MFLASDNGGPAAPEIMDAVVKANIGNAPGYGADALMDEVRREIRRVFEAPEAAVYLVATGTAANALGLASLVQPWHSIYCTSPSHIEVDECGAPEFYTGGAKLTHVADRDAKMDAGAFAAQIAQPVRGVHHVQPGAVSLTNLTELGTAYTVAEIAALAKLAKDANLRVHMDGARFANALVATNASAADMTWRAGVDVLSFGGTKNGCMGVEAVVLFDPKLAWEFELRRKRGGHLFSKHRYLSAQMLAYLTDDLWRDLAVRANDTAAQLEKGLHRIGAEMIHPRHANMIFAALPRAVHKRARAAGAYYYFWPNDWSLEGDADEMLQARMVCHCSTTQEDIDAFLAACA